MRFWRGRARIRGTLAACGTATSRFPILSVCAVSLALCVCLRVQRMHRAVQVDKQRLAERERERAELGLVDGGLVPSAGAAGSGSSNSSNNKAQR